MKYRKINMGITLLTTAILLLSSMQSALADNHALPAEQKGVDYPHVEGMKGLLFKQKTVDNYKLTFHVMGVEPSEATDCAYQLMFKAEYDGKLVKELLVNSRVTHPGGQSESKMMMKAGDWYIAAYDLTHPGKHKLQVLFKTRDSQTHSATVNYVVEKQE